MGCCNKRCCLCCCCYEDFQQSTYYLKIVQITFAALSILGNEITFLYLDSTSVDWRTGGFPAFDIHRAVLWSALLTTSAALYLYAKRNAADAKQPNTCLVCGGLDLGQAYYQSPTIRVPEKKWNIDFADFIHSLLLATSFMLCAVCMLSDIPKTYKSHIQVDMKLISFVTDMVLGLIYTKSCIVAYNRYEGPLPCDCTVNPAWGQRYKHSDSRAPTAGEHEIETNENQPLTKCNNGNMYTKIGS